jgi:oligopeptide transport system substrate-binding protein
MTTVKHQPLEAKRDVLPPGISFPSHSSFFPVQQKLVSWVTRFPRYEDPFLFRELLLFYLLAGEKYLDYRHPTSLARLIKAIYFMQKKLLQSSTLSSVRHLEIKWISSQLNFSFLSKSVLGCLVGFNLVERYEIFDEENVSLILQKHFPEFQLVKDSSYAHVSSTKDFKIFYFEIEKINASSFGLQQQIILKKQLEQKLKNGVQRLAPNIFMKRNEEEVYKNALVLCEQIQSIDDLPQVIIHLDQQTLSEIIFLVTVVCIAPPTPLSFQEKLPDGFFALERQFTLRYVQNHPIEAHIFRIHLHRKPMFLRSDGSLDFYSARRKVAQYLLQAVGEFRDYNGGILLKQQELMQSLKEHYSSTSTDVELLETFFYSITPLEKQVLLQPNIVVALFELFLECQQGAQQGNYTLNIENEGGVTLLTLSSTHLSLKEMLTQFLKNDDCTKNKIAYNLIEQNDSVYFQCVIFPMDEGRAFIAALQEALALWEKKITNPLILRIGFEYALLSLDPRKGGDAVSQVISGLLFEGLTWFDGFGKIRNGIAKKIDHSENHTEYTFHLRDCVWSDGTLISAHDFEYAWKKVLSPDFKTSFSYLFYPIRGAKEAKAGLAPLDHVGVKALDDKTLRVDLKHPTPYFLELTSHPIYSPIHRIVDQRHPEWPNQSGKSFPCNGAFALKVNHPSQGYKLEKNPLYWDADNIALDQITFNQMTSQRAFEAFRKGEIDWLGHPLGSWHTFYTPGPNDRVISISNATVYWFIFNTLKKPFHLQKLRQAISLAIQRSEFLPNSPLPLTPAFSPLPHQHSSSTAPRLSHNVELARKLWKEGWEELGVPLNKIPSFTLCYHHKGAREHIAAHLQRQLQECFQVAFELQPLPWDLQFEKMTGGDFDIGLAQWTPWIDDSIYTLNAFRFPHENLNLSGWSHPKFQALLDRCEQEFNPAQRMAYFAAAEEMLCQELPVIPLFYQSFLSLVKNNINVSYNIFRATFNFARCFYRKKEFSYDSKHERNG